MFKSRACIKLYVYFFFQREGGLFQIFKTTKFQFQYIFMHNTNNNQDICIKRFN